MSDDVRRWKESIVPTTKELEQLCHIVGNVKTSEGVMMMINPTQIVQQLESVIADELGKLS